MGPWFWIRWSWRDLRRRIPQVLAIAAILGLGSGTYSGLGSTSAWRRSSLDASLARYRAADLRVSLLGGTSAPTGELVGAVRSALDAQPAALQARLHVSTPVTARPSSSSPIDAAGEIVGTDVAHPAAVDRLQVTAGRELTGSDAGRPVALLDQHFAHEHGLPPTGVLRAGQTEIRYVGLALSPAYLNLNTTIGETIQGQATRAILFTSIETANGIDGTEGHSDEVAIRLPPGARPGEVAQRLGSTLAARFPALPVQVTTRSQDIPTTALYDEIDSEQRVFDVFAFLVLGGAAFAAFSLVKRVVEGQRREIGISMSLGVARWRIAIRPLLLALEVTALGVGVGIAVGVGVATWVRQVIASQLPLPVWVTPFRAGLFARAAILTVLVPLVACAVPVVKAVRTKPTDALLPPHLVGRARGLRRITRRLRLPGSMLTQAPVRRILGAPLRSTLTVLAIAVVMAPLLAAMGAADTTTATIEAGDRAVAEGRSDVLLTTFATFQPEGSPLVAELRSMSSDLALGVDTGGYLLQGRTRIGVSVSMVDLADPLAAPPSVVDQRPRPGGIVLSRKAAADLHLSVGDLVTFRHPRRVGTSFSWVEDRLPVRAIHESPYRFVAYMDLRDRDLFGLDGLVDAAKLRPAAGESMAGLRSRVAELPGIASALPATAASATMRSVLSLLERMFTILELVIGTLAFLVAFNASRVAADERRREHASMLAFGVPLWRVLALGVTESVLLGLVGAAVGLGFGASVLAWVLETVFPAAAPDLAVIPQVQLSSYLLTIGIAAAASALAPILNLRRLRTMDLPSTLRYVE